MEILVVDDSKAMRMLVKRALRQAGFAGLQVVEAQSGKEALRHLEMHRPGLILADWNMPEMSGIELLEELRRNGSNVRLGFVTSEGTAEIRARAHAAGALFVITKPFTPDTFRETLEPILG